MIDQINAKCWRCLFSCMDATINNNFWLWIIKISADINTLNISSFMSGSNCTQPVIWMDYSRVMRIELCQIVILIKCKSCGTKFTLFRGSELGGHEHGCKLGCVWSLGLSILIDSVIFSWRSKCISKSMLVSARSWVTLWRSSLLTTILLTWSPTLYCGPSWGWSQFNKKLSSTNLYKVSEFSAPSVYYWLKAPPTYNQYRNPS